MEVAVQGTRDGMQTSDALLRVAEALRTYGERMKLDESEGFLGVEGMTNEPLAVAPFVDPADDPSPRLAQHFHLLREGLLGWERPERK